MINAAYGDIRKSQLRTLCELIEEAVGQKIKSRKDFDFLSEQIFVKLHDHISPTTLKRVWGYLDESTIPRQSTLDILSRFVDYNDWAHFCQEHSEELGEEDEAEKTAVKTKPRFPFISYSLLRYYALIITILMLVLVGVIAKNYFHPSFFHKSEAHVIRVGDSFTNPQQYLQLFGIYAKDSLWGQVLPHHPKVSIWGPQYHHPEWHNEGDKKKMMPTITEYWAPEGRDSILIAQRNYDQYKHYRRLNEVRITFMKDLVDSNYVYLGIYRLSLSLSDTTKCVWERVAGDCDLNKLDYVDELSN